MLTDDDDSYGDPSGAEVKKALEWLCMDRSEDDVIFFHFSGHGTQVPCDGGTFGLNFFPTGESMKCSA